MLVTLSLLSRLSTATHALKRRSFHWKENIGAQRKPPSPGTWHVVVWYKFTHCYLKKKCIFSVSEEILPPSSGQIWAYLQNDEQISVGPGSCTDVIHTQVTLHKSGFSGLEVACWPLVPKFAGSNLAETVGFFRAKKFSARFPSEGKKSHLSHVAYLRHVKKPESVCVEVAAISRPSSSSFHY